MKIVFALMGAFAAGMDNQETRDERRLAGLGGLMRKRKSWDRKNERAMLRLAEHDAAKAAAESVTAAPPVPTTESITPGSAAAISPVAPTVAAPTAAVIDAFPVALPVSSPEPASASASAVAAAAPVQYEDALVGLTAPYPRFTFPAAGTRVLLDGPTLPATIRGLKGTVLAADPVTWDTTVQLDDGPTLKKVKASTAAFFPKPGDPVKLRGTQAHAFSFEFGHHSQAFSVFLRACVQP
jgi:hypothetical protein